VKQPQNIATISVQTKPLSNPTVTTCLTSTTCSLPLPPMPRVKVVTTAPLRAKAQTPQFTASSSALVMSAPIAHSCQTCVSTATKEIVEQCPVGKVAVIWYDECMLRYSNQSFFSTMDKAPTVSLYNTQNITEPDRFTELLGTAMNDIASRAPNAPSGAKKFATKEAKFTDLQTLYNHVQCNPVLSTSECNRCLRIVIGTLPSCCNGKQGANVLNPSCNVRYEVYQFYKVQAVPPPPTPVHQGCQYN
jgi:hypothetical protein